MRPGSSNQSGLRFVSGIICKTKVLKFERMLFRATRGNMLFNQAPADDNIVDPITFETVFPINILILENISIASLLRGNWEPWTPFYVLVKCLLCPFYLQLAEAFVKKHYHFLRCNNIDYSVFTCAD